MKPTRIMIAEDHFLVRQLFKEIIRLGDNLEVIGEAGDGLELLKILKTQPPDIVLMDLSMPRMGGLEATRILKKIYPQVEVLIITLHKDERLLYKALEHGAKGYLLKDEAHQGLVPAITAVAQGMTYISSSFDRLTACLGTPFNYPSPVTCP